MSVSIHFERDLSAKTVSASIDFGFHDDDSPVARWGVQAMRYARQISESKSFDLSEHIQDNGATLTIECDDLPEIEDEDDEFIDDPSHDFMAGIDDETECDFPIYTTKLNLHGAEKRIGGNLCPSVVMGRMVQRGLEKALAKASDADRNAAEA